MHCFCLGNLCLGIKCFRVLCRDALFLFFVGILFLTTVGWLLIWFDVALECFSSCEWLFPYAGWLLEAALGWSSTYSYLNRLRKVSSSSTGRGAWALWANWRLTPCHSSWTSTFPSPISWLLFWCHYLCEHTHRPEHSCLYQYTSLHKRDPT